MRAAFFLPLLLTAGCTIHSGPGSSNNTTAANPAPAPTTAPAPAPTTAPTAAPTAAPATTPPGTVNPVAPASTGVPSGIDVKKPMLRAPEITKVNVFGGPKPTDKTIKGEVFTIPEGTKQLPNFNPAMTPFATVYTQSFDVSPRKFTEGFPGVNDRVEWYAIRWEGKVTAKTAGVHVFKLKSDDGARVSLNGQLVVNNDGLHAPTDATGNVLLNAGEQTLVVEYFQGPKYEVALQIWVTAPNGQPKILTSSF